MRPLPGFLRATALEYKHRYLVHGCLYTLGFAAPWHLPVWGFLRNQSTWFVVTDALTKPLYTGFAPVWNTLCAVALVCAAAGAGLRVWGAAYLGATTVHRGGMEGDRIVANGPYRFVRNPLYLGTLLHTVALALLMRPEAGAGMFFLLLIVQLRLIGREEPFLLETQGSAYAAYCASAPRLLPLLRPVVGGDERPDWRQGFLSEIYMVGVALTFAVFGWTRGFSWESSVWHVLQGIVISLGVSVMARAFIPKSQM